MTLDRRCVVAILAAALPQAALGCVRPPAGAADLVPAEVAVQAAAPAALAGTAWTVRRIGTLEVPPEVEATMDFVEGGRVAGSTGCNRFSGSYAQSGDRLSLGPLATTRRACTGGADAVERAFVEAVAGPLVVGAQVPDGSLALTSPAGVAILLVPAG